MQRKLKVGIIGAGIFGTSLTFVLAETIKKHSIFDEILNIWLRDEIIDNHKLVDYINSNKINKKYLHGVNLPENILATIDKEIAKELDIIIFSIPHEFFISVCQEMKFKEDALLISVTKGFLNDDLLTPASFLRNTFKRKSFALMGPNIAIEIVNKVKSKSTIGYEKEDEDIVNNILLPLFNTGNFIVDSYEDTTAVEVCGAFKNTIAIAYGTAEGLGLGYNSITAIFGEGINEMRRFLRKLNKGEEVLFKSCGVSDLLVTCLKGRNKEYGVKLVEKEVLICETQGVGTCKWLFKFILKWYDIKEFPLIAAVFKILTDYTADIQQEILKAII